MVQVRDVMTEATITETPADKLRSAAERMRRIRHLPVVENGQLLGVVSMRDVTGVFGALGAGDSEIDIEHEFDQLVRKRRLARIERGDLA